MHTGVAFSESIDPGAVFVNIAGVPDQHVKVQGDGIYVSEYNRLLGALACIGTTGVEARLVSPSLRRINPHYITPINMLLIPTALARAPVDRALQYALDINEALECQILSDPAGAEQNTVVVFLSPGAITPVSGEIVTVNAEVTITLVAGEWAFAEIDFIDELPIGNYAVVGLNSIVAAGVCARLVPVGMPFRPGSPCSPTAASINNGAFRNGQLGEWFRFSSIQPPGLEILSSAAAGSATYQLYIDIMKV